MDKKPHEAVTETHHALLFAWITREVIMRFGVEKGEVAIRKATRRYGEQRGQRMALRARADGRQLSMADFMVYGEWTPSDPSAMESETVAEGPHIRVQVSRCPWSTVWSREGLLGFGRLYCQEIDHALVRGFNPDLRLDVNKTQTNDGEPCEFVFHEASQGAGPELVENEAGAAGAGERTVMPWDYHCGHLYKTFSETLVGEFGETGLEAVRGAMDQFTARFGELLAQAILSRQDMDYDNLPD